MSGLLRRLSSRFSRKKDEPSRTGTGTGTATLFPPAYSKEDLIGIPRVGLGNSQSFSATEASRSHRKLSPWASISRIASNIMSPRRRKSRKSSTRDRFASNDTHLDNSLTNSDIEGGSRDEKPFVKSRSRWSLLRSKSSRNAGDHSSARPTAETSARKRRWQIREHNRRMDRQAESSRPGDLDTPDGTPGSGRSPVNINHPTVPYRSLKLGGLSTLADSDQLCSSSLSTSFVTISDASFTSGSEEQCTETPNKSATTKITYISCPNRGEKDCARSGPNRRRPQYLEGKGDAQRDVTYRCLPSNTNIIFQSPAGDPALDENCQSNYVTTSRRPSFRLQMRRPNKMLLNRRASEPSYKENHSIVPGALPGSGQLGNIRGTPLRTPSTKKTPSSYFKARLRKHSDASKTASHHRVDVNQNVSTLSREKTGSHRVVEQKLRRTRSLDDIVNYERYYNFLCTADAGERDRDILTSFVQQLKAFHVTLPSLMPKSPTPSLIYSTIDEEWPLDMTHGSIELSEYCLSYMEGKYPDVFRPQSNEVNKQYYLPEPTQYKQADDQGVDCTDNIFDCYDHEFPAILDDTSSTIKDSSEDTFIIESLPSKHSDWSFGLQPSPSPRPVIAGSIKQVSHSARAETTIQVPHSARAETTIQVSHSARAETTKQVPLYVIPEITRPVPRSVKAEITKPMSRSVIPETTKPVNVSRLVPLFTPRPFQSITVRRPYFAPVASPLATNSPKLETNIPNRCNTKEAELVRTPCTSLSIIDKNIVNKNSPAGTGKYFPGLNT